MSLDKAIEHGKEKRKPYRGSKEFFGSCRNHGKCTRCMNGRLYQRNKVEEASKQRSKEYE